MSSHYTKDEQGRDYLARCEDSLSTAQMEGAYLFTIGKYLDRAGKKPGEDVAKEMAKVVDYGQRAILWHEDRLNKDYNFEALIKEAVRIAQDRIDGR